MRGTVRVQIVTPPADAAMEVVNALAPLVLLGLLLNPRLRWALVDVARRLAYGWRLAAWRQRWVRIPGWRQELWNHDRLPPDELRSPEPGWVKRG